MQPEISRRCTSCGAAVRANATFCPQCGKPQGQQPAAAPEPGPASEEAAPDAGPINDIGPARENSAPAPLPSSRVVVTGEQPQPQRRAPLESSEEAAGGGDGSRAGRQRLERARAVARGAMEEKVAPRVEKLRQTSSVVLDEAADDPSLRFVLIAAVLFIAALVLFLISRLLG